ncbi:MAG: 4Fe-4S dicluster domain-containing protein [bacterium]
MAKNTVLIDLNKCTGCRGCQVACKSWHQQKAVKTEFFKDANLQNPPLDSQDYYTLVKFKEVMIKGKVRWFFRKHQCMHCREAPCVKVCPLKAIEVSPAGYSWIVPEKCDGCGVCVDVCPFDVIKKFDTPGKGVKCDKCDFCHKRLELSLAPACVTSCSTEAMTFGERADQLELAGRIIKLFPKLRLYGKNQMGGLGFFYIYEGNPDYYDLPADPTPITPFINMFRAS